MKTEEFKVKDFSSIVAGGAFEIEIVRAESYSVSITADDDLFKNLKVAKEGETLRIGHSKHLAWFSQITRPKARVTLPLLKGLHLSGATRGTVSGFDSSENLKLNLSGASHVTGQITAGNVEFDLSGASHAELAGSARDVIIDASGASRAELDSFSVQKVAVKLSGASHTTIKTDGALDARLSGASHLSWIGNPVMGDIRTSGASRLSKKISLTQPE